MINLKMLLALFVSFTIFHEVSFCQKKWNSINYKDKLKDTLFVSDHFIYSNNSFLDKQGKWKSNLYDEIGRQIIDTSLYLIGADCIIENGDPHQIRFTKCKSHNDTLTIDIFDHRPAYSDNIEIECIDGEFSSDYQTNFTAQFPGQEYVWEIKNQNFQKGKWLYAHINLDIDEFFKSDNYPLSYSKVKIKGFFKCVIE